MSPLPNAHNYTFGNVTYKNESVKLKKNKIMRGKQKIYNITKSIISLKWSEWCLSVLSRSLLKIDRFLIAFFLTVGVLRLKDTQTAHRIF